MAHCLILIAPDSFKGSLTAEEACLAIAQGLTEAWPEASLRRLPLSDGGEGFLACAQAAMALESRVAVLSGPDGQRREARWLYDPVERRAWIETAEIIPLHGVGADGVGAGTSRGVGEAIRIAAAHGAQQICLGIGGTGTIDGGAGCLVGLGAILRDAAGETMDPGSSRLGEVRSIELNSTELPEIELLCDVRSPMVGPRGAAHLYGPQKGLDADAVQRVERDMGDWARRLDERFECDPSELAFAGAGGGLAGALMAACGAVPRSGIERLAERVQLDAAITAATLVITGEGRVDAQSQEGKVIAHVLARAQEIGRPVQVLAGRVDADAGAWLAARGARARACAPDSFSDSQAIAQAHELLTAAAYEVFAEEG
jgi:glycerate 2-kinase